MRLFLICLLFLGSAPPALAWNAAGHRLVAVIAWQELSPATRQAIGAALAGHPDHGRWVERARSAEDVDVFAEAASWPDDIRNDRRFHDEGREAPTPPLPGLPDTARHKDWHYVDLDDAGRARSGQIDRQIERLTQVLRSTAKNAEISNALPWLIHLVADIHQPLHVGRHGDEGGNRVEIENPFNQRLPFSSLHLYWDDRPGPPCLRLAASIEPAHACSQSRRPRHATRRTAYPMRPHPITPVAPCRPPSDRASTAATIRPPGVAAE